MEDTPRVEYICSNCNQIVDEVAVQEQSHPCWLVEQDGGSITINYEDGDDSNIQYVEDLMEEQSDNIQVIVGDDNVYDESTMHLTEDGIMVYEEEQAVDEEKYSQNVEFVEESQDQYDDDEYVSAPKRTRYDSDPDYAPDSEDEEKKLRKVKRARIVCVDEKSLMEDQTSKPRGKSPKKKAVTFTDAFASYHQSSFQKVIPEPVSEVKPVKKDWLMREVEILIEVYEKHCRLRKYKINSLTFWNNIMKDLSLGYDLQTVQAKLLKLKKIYKSLHKDKGEQQWSLYDKMHLLHKAEVAANGGESLDEASGEETASDIEQTDPDGEVTGIQRWKTQETRHLLQVYQKHLSKFFVGGHRRRVAWNDILADLQYGLPQRFSVFQMRAKIRNLVTTYKRILSGDRRKTMTTSWPLYDDVSALIRKEAELSFKHGAKDDTCSADPASYQVPQSTDTDSQIQRKPVSAKARWNPEETKELLIAYKPNIPQLLSASVGEDMKSVVWDNIALHVNTVRYREISGEHAKKKIKDIREDYNNGATGFVGVIMEDVRDVMEAEQAFLQSEASQDFSYLDENVEQKVQTVYLTQPVEQDERLKKLPPWYQRYTKDCQRRHEEKLMVQHEIIDVLETILRS